MNIFRAINKWIAPYKYDNEIEQTKKERSSKKKKVKLNKVTKEDKKPTELDAVNRGELGVKIITLNNQIDEDTAFQRLDNSASHIAYYYHSNNRHQIAVRFEQQSGFRYYQRNPAKLQRFKPMIYPKNKTYDKTHLIPLGFNGTENYPRLNIGWNRKLNRGAIKKHEQKVININKNHTIFWFVDVEKRNESEAYWTSTVWFEDGELLDRKKFVDKDKFHWPS